MKPHIFKDNGWKVGIDDRAYAPRGDLFWDEPTELRRVMSLAALMAPYEDDEPQGGQKITREAARNTAQSPHPLFFRENRA